MVAFRFPYAYVPATADCRLAFAAQDFMTSMLDATVTADSVPMPAVIEKAPLTRYVAPDRPSLVGLTRAEIIAALGDVGVPPAQRKMRMQQLWHWIYVRGAAGFDVMTNMSKEMRAMLEGRFTLGRPGGRCRTGIRRRHPQMAAAVAGGKHRRASS